MRVAYGESNVLQCVYNLHMIDFSEFNNQSNANVPVNNPIGLILQMTFKKWLYYYPQWKSTTISTRTLDQSTICERKSW